LDAYIANYSNTTKLNRLLFIANHCPSYAVDAYKLAINHLQADSLDCPKYADTIEKLNLLLKSTGSSHPEDLNWIDRTLKLVESKSNKLEADLKNFKTTFVKETIRMGHEDLGNHYLASGDLTGALKVFGKIKEYCTTPKHIIDYCMKLIEVNVHLGNYSAAQSLINKAHATPEIPDDDIVLAKLQCVQGLVDLSSGKFESAAYYFLDTSFQLEGKYSEVISPNDIATYGALCALSTFTRAELKKKVFENSDFKQYLELEPEIRELMYCFYHSKYANCLEILEKKKGDLLLDIYLHQHVEIIIRNIRKKALVQYFSPFLSVDMNKMASSFNISLPSLQIELAQLITEKQIYGKIDSHNKILRIKKNDQRSALFEKCTAMGNEYSSKCQFSLLRMQMIESNLIVKDSNKERD
jgi:COP9 signalosome complex subunit 1